MIKESSQSRKMLRHSAVYAAGNISRQLISFIMLPVYTHYLSPADYGVVGLISFAIAIFETLLGAKMVQALPRYYHEGATQVEKDTVVSTAFVITGASSLLTVSGIFIFRETLSQTLFESDRFSLIVGLCGLQMLTQALEYYSLMYVRLCEKPGTFVTMNLVKLAAQLLANIILVVHFRLGVLGVVVSGLLTSAIFAIVLTSWTLLRVGIRVDGAVARRMVSFSWPLWLSGLASLYIYSSNRYFIRIFDSLSSVGLYELAAKFSGILTLLVWIPFSQYWQTEQFKIMQRSDSASVFSSVFRFASCFLIMLGLGISIYSGSVLEVMASASFKSAERAVPFLIAVTILSSFTELAGARLLASGDTKWLSRNNYLTAVVVTALYAALIPAAGFVGAACALATAQLVQFWVVQHTVRKRYGFKIDLGPVLLMAIVAAVTYILSIAVFQQSNIWVGIAFKTALYSLASGVLMAILLSDDEARRRFLDLTAAARNSWLRLTSASVKLPPSL